MLACIYTSLMRRLNSLKSQCTRPCAPNRTINSIRLLKTWKIKKNQKVRMDIPVCLFVSEREWESERKRMSEKVSEWGWKRDRQTDRQTDRQDQAEREGKILSTITHHMWFVDFLDLTSIITREIEIVSLTFMCSYVRVRNKLDREKPSNVQTTLRMHGHLMKCLSGWYF